MEVQKWKSVINVVHLWQVAAAIGATQVNEAEDANDVGEKPTGYEGQTEENVLSAVFADEKESEH